MRARCLLLVCVSATILLAVSLVVSLRPKPKALYDVVFLPTVHDCLLVPRAINDLGQVVDAVSAAEEKWYLFLWDREGGTRELGPCPSSASFDCVLLNNVGQITMAGTDPNRGVHAFFRDTNGVWHDLRARGGEQVHPCGINNRGQVIGYLEGKRDSRQAFVWDTVRGMQSLALSDAVESTADGVNDAGQVVGFLLAKRDDLWHAFFWDPNAGVRDLGPSPSPGTCRVNNQGFVVGQFGSAEDPTCISTWTAKEGARRLRSLGAGRVARARSLNDGNRFIVGIARSEFELRYLGYSQHIDTYLGDPNGHLTNIANCLNGIVDGEFIGNGINDQGQITGLLLRKGDSFPQSVVLIPIK